VITLVVQTNHFSVLMLLVGLWHLPCKNSASKTLWVGGVQPKRLCINNQGDHSPGKPGKVRETSGEV